MANVDNPKDMGLTMASLALTMNGAGLFASVIGIWLIIRSKKEDPGDALNNGTYLSTLLFVIIAAIITLAMAAAEPEYKTNLWAAFGTSVVGILSGLVIGLTTDYYTDDRKKPTRAIAASSEQGHALNILTGFSYGLMSVGAPVIGICVAMYLSYEIGQNAGMDVGVNGGFYGIAMASNGMLAIVATIVGNDAYGPIVDNARGIAEQGGLSEEVIRTCDRLDSAGNTAKAITKGLSIGAAALTVLGLLFSYIHDAETQGWVPEANEFDIIQNPIILIGLLLGAMIPCVYSAILIRAVDRNAQVMVKEIRRQFKEQPGILKGEVAADFNKCIDIATAGSLKELVIPSLISLLAPVIVGVVMGIAGLAAFLAGSIISGFIFALLMSNAGGAWDNAKKFIEDGNYGGKGTLAHSASITGDTVGDPFKDTAGPSINTLICVLSLASEIFLPLFIAVELA
jgi:K(+)-stimulated pyrophosphate-energized sodium pump